MSVTRRNTFDLFDEEAELLSTSEGRSAHKKKRRRKRTSVESLLSQAHPVAGESRPAAELQKHEVRPDMLSVAWHAH